MALPTDCIRVFVASGERWAAHRPVLEYSIHRHASQPVSVTFVDPEEYGLGRMGCTGFTHVRWAVPELAGNGFAIYLDIDMLLLADIADLWNYRQPGRYACLRDGSTEVMVMDSAVRMPAKESLRQYGKPQLLSMARPHLAPVIPLEWNSKDALTEGAKLLHFTDLKRQPWFTPDRDDEAVQELRRYESLSQSA